jgi:hypothetical protein
MIRRNGGQGRIDAPESGEQIDDESRLRYPAVRPVSSRRTACRVAPGSFATRVRAAARAADDFPPPPDQIVCECGRTIAEQGVQRVGNVGAVGGVETSTGGHRGEKPVQRICSAFGRVRRGSARCDVPLRRSACPRRAHTVRLRPRRQAARPVRSAAAGRWDQRRGNNPLRVIRRSPIDLYSPGWDGRHGSHDIGRELTATRYLPPVSQITAHQWSPAYSPGRGRAAKPQSWIRT